MTVKKAQPVAGEQRVKLVASKKAQAALEKIRKRDAELLRRLAK